MKYAHGLSLVLLLVGGLNWGLVGLGALAGGDWNAVHMLLGSWSWLESLVYVLVGLAALYELTTHKKNCKMCGMGGSLM